MPTTSPLDEPGDDGPLVESGVIGAIFRAMDEGEGGEGAATASPRPSGDPPPALPSEAQSGQ